MQEKTAGSHSQNVAIVHASITFPKSKNIFKSQICTAIGVMSRATLIQDNDVFVIHLYCRSNEKYSSAAKVPSHAALPGKASGISPD